MTETSQLLNHHRSIRSYKPDPIDPALVEQVCADAIAGGSSSGNLNSVTLVLTRDAERKRKLYELHFEQEMVLQAPLVITFYEQREVRGWARYMAFPELKARIEELGITSLAQFYTSTAKYDPDVFRSDSDRLRALLEAKHFLP